MMRAPTDMSRNELETQLTAERKRRKAAELVITNKVRHEKGKITAEEFNRDYVDVWQATIPAEEKETT